MKDRYRNIEACFHTDKYYCKKEKQDGLIKTKDRIKEELMTKEYNKKITNF